MKIKVALVQESPVFFDKEKTIQLLEERCHQYAKENCQLIVFPESFIPGYPRGFSFGTVVGSRSEEGRALYADYYNNSISVEGEEVKRLEKLARTLDIYLVIGITEKLEKSGSLFCSMLYISPRSGFLGVHRKIKPTGQERVIWSEAAGESLVSFQTAIGKLGGLICWENYMPLARMAMYQQGVEIYVAPTADSRNNWTATMQHIALEGRCFVLGCNQYFTRSMYPPQYQSFVETQVEECCRGGSIIVSPFGEILAGPLFGQTGVLMAELDLDEVVKSKLDFDVIGHYARDDIFDLTILGQPPMQQE